MEYWLWLSAIKGLGPKSCQRLLDALGDPANIYQADYPTLTAIEGIGDRTARALLEARSLDEARRLLEDCQKKGIHILTCQDPLYHPGLRRLDNPPLLLYVKGRLLPDRPSVALVGSSSNLHCSHLPWMALAMVLSMLGHLLFGALQSSSMVMVRFL